jgi:hypothetical protein
MTAQARSGQQEQQVLSPNENAVREMEENLRLALFKESNSPPAKKVAISNDWAATLDLVDETANALEKAEKRLAELEARNQDVLRQTRGQLQAAKAKIEDAEARALKAEQKAAELIQHLARIHERLNQGAARRTMVEAATPQRERSGAALT